MRKKIAVTLALIMLLTMIPFATAVAAAPDRSWFDADPTADVFYISTAAELLGLAQVVNTNVPNTNFRNQTIRLAADINLQGIAWTSIGSGTTENLRFEGTFDGQGYTISNLTGGPLFTNTFAPVIRNLVLTNVNVTGRGALVNRVATANLGTGRISLIENVQVLGGIVNNTSTTTTGGLVGESTSSVGAPVEALRIVNCVVMLTRVSTGGNVVGGIIGTGSGSIIQDSFALNTEVRAQAGTGVMQGLIAGLGSPPTSATATIINSFAWDETVLTRVNTAPVWNDDRPTTGDGAPATSADIFIALGIIMPGFDPASVCLDCNNLIINCDCGDDVVTGDADITITRPDPKPPFLLNPEGNAAGDLFPGALHGTGLSFGEWRFTGTPQTVGALNETSVVYGYLDVFNDPFEVSVSISDFLRISDGIPIFSAFSLQLTPSGNDFLAAFGGATYNPVVPKAPGVLQLVANSPVVAFSSNAVGHGYVNYQGVLTFAQDRPLLGAANAVITWDIAPVVNP